LKENKFTIPSVFAKVDFDLENQRYEENKKKEKSGVQSFKYSQKIRNFTIQLLIPQFKNVLEMKSPNRFSNHWKVTERRFFFIH